MLKDLNSLAQIDRISELETTIEEGAAAYDELAAYIQRSMDLLNQYEFLLNESMRASGELDSEVTNLKARLVQIDQMRN
jgi:hypothetical protein